MSVFRLNSSTVEVETSRRRLKLKPRPHLCGAWPVKLQPQKAFEYLSSVCNVRVVILQIQYVGPATSVSTAVHSVVLSGVLRYSVVLLSVFWFSSSTFSHVACWCFCQYAAWPPGGAVTVCMPSRSFQVKGLFAAVARHSRSSKTVSVLTNSKANAMILSRLFLLKSLGTRLCAFFFFKPWW